jgi:hypothetical protein
LSPYLSVSLRSCVACDDSRSKIHLFSGIDKFRTEAVLVTPFSVPFSCHMVSTSFMRSHRFNVASLECCIRTALELGELSPGLELQIKHWETQCHLSEHDRTLLKILQGAIEEGCIRRISAQ